MKSFFHRKLYFILKWRVDQRIRSQKCGRKHIRQSISNNMNALHFGFCDVYSMHSKELGLCCDFLSHSKFTFVLKLLFVIKGSLQNGIRLRPQGCGLVPVCLTVLSFCPPPSVPCHRPNLPVFLQGSTYTPSLGDRKL